MNNTSRSLREQFQADEFSSSTMAHSFRRRSDQQFPRTESAPNMDDFQQTQAKRVKYFSLIFLTNKSYLDNIITNSRRIRNNEKQYPTKYRSCFYENIK